MPKLTLRDLFWLVLVVAMGAGWWIDHRRQEQNARRHDENYAMELAESEVRKRDRWKSASSSRIASIVIGPAGREFTVIVTREPSTPGGHRYVTVTNGKVTNYEKGL